MGATERDTPEMAAFRTELRAWLDANARPRDDANRSISVVGGFRDEPESIDEARRWQRSLADAGWAAVTWPVEHGGRGASPAQAIVYGEELARFDVPSTAFSIGIGMIGPTIIAHGTAAQRERYLRPMLRGDEIWCQLWSEPGAGSDLASLATRADRDGDEYVLNGQKVWTSGAHYCELGLGIFRSDPDVPKHQGITCLIVPMDTPGIEIRPLRQINGKAHFNEVFFTDVRVPVANRVGEAGEGWTVARTTLMNERFAVSGLGSSEAGFAALVGLARSVARGGGDQISDPVVRQRLAHVYSVGKVLDLTTARVKSSLSRGMIPGIEGSILKLAMAQLGTELVDAGTDLLGPAGGWTGPAAPEEGRWPDALLGSFAMHIGGGTDEIQRNIIGESVLGLPREPSVDRDVPFRDLRTGAKAGDDR